MVSRHLISTLRFFRKSFNLFQQKGARIISTTLLQKGFEYSFSPDRSALQYGYLPLEPPLRALFPHEPEEYTVLLQDQEGKHVEVTVNNREDLLEGEGLLEMELFDSRLCRLQVVDPERMSFKILPFWKQSSGQAPEVVEALEELKLVSEKDYYLHQRARGLTLQSGFDQLLSLPSLRELEPFDYQLEAAKRVLQKMRGRALLSDEVGLGKTIEAGLIMKEYMIRGLVKKVLILVPPSLVSQWREEMRVKFNLEFISYDSSSFKKKENGWEYYDRVIASLHTAKRKNRRQLIEKIDYDLVIVDEAHHLKNRSTLNWKLVNRLKKKYILLLTATPVQNKLEELFNLITLLRPGQLETAREFKDKYITRGDRLKPKNPEELKKLVRGVMIRNKRSHNRLHLTSRYARVIEVSMKSREKEFYQRLNNLLHRQYTRQEGQRGINRLVLKILQRETGSSIRAVIPTLKGLLDNEGLSEEMREFIGQLIAEGAAIEKQAKPEALVELIKGINDRVIVFTSFRATQDYLEARLNRAGISTTVFHGQLRRAEKESCIDTFREGRQVLLSTESGGEGRNLQFCNRMINYDLPWNPMLIEQRIGRIHRIGQERDVYIYNLAVRETIESYLLELLDAKINMFELVVGELDMILGNLQDRREFEEIIMDIWLESYDSDQLKERFNSFGEELLEAKKEYNRTMEYDGKLFGEMFEDGS